MWRRLAAVLVALLCCGLIAGLWPATGPGPGDRATWAAALTRAVGSHDHTAFGRLVTADLRARKPWLWTNLTGLDRFRLEADGDLLLTTWSVTGDAASARHRIGGTLRCRPRCLLDDLTPIAATPTPIWLTAPVTITRHQLFTLVSSGDEEPGQALRQASDAVERARLGVLSQGWNGSVVVLAPSSAQDFAAVMGTPAVHWAGTAALAQEDGVPGTGAVRVVINPDADLSGDLAALVLAHEAVHVVTAALGRTSPGRLWVSEGLADAVALPLAPDERRRSVGMAAGLSAPPADADFASRDQATAQRAYARGWALIAGVLTDPAARADQVLLDLWRGRPGTPLPRLVSLARQVR